MENIKYKFKLTEEICRWAYEVNIMKDNDWYIGFTNPTAGPWKKINFKDDEGLLTEVYRFEVEEKRPDIVLINDTLKQIMIIEAKDSYKKLLTNTQPQKTIDVVLDMKRKLEASNNPLIKQKIGYEFIVGLLWGCNSKTSEKDKKHLVDVHSEILTTKDSSIKKIITIESQFLNNQFNICESTFSI